MKRLILIITSTLAFMHSRIQNEISTGDCFIYNADEVTKYAIIVSQIEVNNGTKTIYAIVASCLKNKQMDSIEDISKNAFVLTSQFFDGRIGENVDGLFMLDLTLSDVQRLNLHTPIGHLTLDLNKAELGSFGGGGLSTVDFNSHLNYLFNFDKDYMKKPLSLFLSA